jgi:hypothetical protein
MDTEGQIEDKFSISILSAEVPAVGRHGTNFQHYIVHWGVKHVRGCFDWEINWLGTSRSGSNKPEWTHTVMGQQVFPDQVLVFEIKGHASSEGYESDPQCS